MEEPAGRPSTSSGAPTWFSVVPMPDAARSPSPGKRPSPRRAALALAGSLAFSGAGLLLLGCPSNACFLKVCHNGQCRCSLSSCGEGAAFDTNQNRCRCLKGTIPLGGLCLAPDEANAYCGVGFFYDAQAGGCAANRCRPGDEVDVSTGLCVPRDQVNQAGASAGVPVGPGEQLSCPAGQKLVVEAGKPTCVPLDQTCARDETWNGTACVKVQQCGAGAVYDTALGQCVQYAQGDDDGLRVNVQQWATSNYGPNGGAGTSAFCGSFAKKPFSFGVVEGSSAVVRVDVMLSFPNGEIGRGVVQTTPVFDASGKPVPGKGAAEVQAAASSILAPLVQGGGKASQPTASTTVKCQVRNAQKPIVVPASGGV